MFRSKIEQQSEPGGEDQRKEEAPKKPAPLKAKAGKHEDLVIPSYGDRELTQRSFFFAVIIHLLVISMSLPERSGPTTAPVESKKIVKRLQIRQPPPRVERQKIQQQLTRKVPIPDPTPEDPEPIVEPEPEPEYNPIPPDAEVVFGIPEGPPAPAQDGPLLVGGNIRRPDRIRMVKPLYPAIAKNAGVEATIVLNVIIDKTGNVAEVQILRGHPLLQDAAIKAVKQWKYQPAIMNGSPVSVIFPVTVEFTLD